MIICQNCACTAAQAEADAFLLGFQEEFKARVYCCCQVVAWADEQALARLEAAQEDGKSLDETTKPSEISATAPELVAVRLRLYKQF
jgi:hypothetical protein